MMTTIFIIGLLGFMVGFLMYLFFYNDDKVKIIEYLERKYDREFICVGPSTFYFNFSNEFYFIDNDIIKYNENNIYEEKIVVFKDENNKSIYHDNYFYFLIRDKLIQDIENILNGYIVGYKIDYKYLETSFLDELVSVVDYNKFISEVNSDLFINVDVSLFYNNLDEEVFFESVKKDLSELFIGGLFVFKLYKDAEYVKTVEIQGCNYEYMISF